MKLSSLNEWLTLGANIGVLGGIVFLAIEINQNNALMESQARFNRLEVARGVPELILNNYPVEWGAAVLKAESELTPDEANALRISWSRTFLGWAWTFSEIPQEEVPIIQWRRTFRGALGQEVWEQRKDEYLPDFVEFMETEIINY